MSSIKDIQNLFKLGAGPVFSVRKTNPAVAEKKCEGSSLHSGKTSQFVMEHLGVSCSHQVPSWNGSRRAGRKTTSIQQHGTAVVRHFSPEGSLPSPSWGAGHPRPALTRSLDAELNCWVNLAPFVVNENRHRAKNLIKGKVANTNVEV